MTKQIEPAFSFVYAGAQINVYHANKGEGLPKHQHTYPHATMCCAGSVIVRKATVVKRLTKESNPVNLVENEWHELEAELDGTVFVNVFAAGKY